MMNIETIEENLEKLLRIEVALKAKLAREEVSQQEYKQTLVRINQERKKWEEKLEDSVADMFANDGSTPPAPEVALDPLAAALQHREDDTDKIDPQDKDPEIKITEVKRGLQDEMRALEIKFHYRDQDCKAIINSKEGRWHFSTHGQSLYLIQFINALRKSPRFAEIFEKEVNRHPDAWYKVVIKGQTFTENHKQKDSRHNFPEICKQTLQRYSSHDSAAGRRKKQKPERLPDLTGKPVVVLKVEHGDYTKVERKDFGKGVHEFPRYITVLLDWGKYHLRAEITTDQCQWEVLPRDINHEYPKELVKKFNQVIPFMVQELERTSNKYLAHTMVTEMRLKDHRHQWEAVVKGSPNLHFPHECKELFTESKEPA